MKIIHIVFFIITVLFPLIGNDSFIDVAGGSLSLSSLEKNNDIQMISEIIEITLYKDYYNTTVNFNFFNNGEEQRISVGFPQWNRGIISDSDFFDFRASYNGVETEFSVLEIEEKPLDRYVYLKKWYVRDLIFPSNSITQTSVSYNVSYGRSYGDSAEYLYGTGSTWANNIGEMKLIIKNNSNRWINNIYFDTEGSNFTIENQNGTVIITHKNISPSISDLIIINTDNMPIGFSGPKLPEPEYYWYYKSEELTDMQMKYLSKEQLRLLRNLLFAAHGHIFKSEDINAWLEDNCSYWYKPEKKVTIEDFNNIEKKNLETIKREEALR